MQKVITEIFTQNIRQRREEKGISVSELAQYSGLPLTMLELLDQGTIPKSMTVDDAWGLAKAFGCETYELFQ